MYIIMYSGRRVGTNSPSVSYCQAAAESAITTECVIVHIFSCYKDCDQNWAQWLASQKDQQNLGAKALRALGGFKHPPSPEIYKNSNQINFLFVRYMYYLSQSVILILHIDLDKQVVFTFIGEYYVSNYPSFVLIIIIVL